MCVRVKCATAPCPITLPGLATEKRGGGRESKNGSSHIIEDVNTKWRPQAKS
jgi:hypothetical protein